MHLLLAITLSCLPNLTSPGPSSSIDTANDRAAGYGPVAFVAIGGKRERIIHLRDLPEELPEEARQGIHEELGSEAAVGFFFKSFHIFWLDIWTWGGEHVLYRGETYLVLDVEVFQEATGIGELEVPSSYRYPLGLLIGIALIVLRFLYVKLGPTSANRAKRLLQDARYQEAHELFTERMTEILHAHQEREQAQAGETSDATAEATGSEATAPGGAPEVSPEDAFQAAVQRLVDYGIPEEEARRNLALITQKVGIELQ